MVRSVDRKIPAVPGEGVSQSSGIPNDPKERERVLKEFYRLAEVICSNGPDAAQARKDLTALLKRFDTEGEA